MSLRRSRKSLKIKNAMAIPRLEKIVVNMGMGEAISNSKVLDTAVDELATITGQKPVITKAKEIDRERLSFVRGCAFGTMVTLRGSRMYDISRSFDFGCASAC